MSISSDNKEKRQPIFKLCSLTPIGFKIPDYPTSICLMCRGPLLSVCDVCMDTKNENCEVIKNPVDENIYHKHCFELIKKIDNVDADKK